VTAAEVGRRWARAWSRHDPEALADLFDAEGEYDDVAFAIVSRGPAGARGWAEGFLAAFPDLVVDIVAESVTEGMEVVEWLMSGTHRGEFDGLSPTDRPFQVRGVTASASGRAGSSAARTTGTSGRCAVNSSRPDVEPARRRRVTRVNRRP
jgi:steroid delta-isomerase-like uncharacterized protein